MILSLRQSKTIFLSWFVQIMLLQRHMLASPSFILILGWGESFTQSLINNKKYLDIIKIQIAATAVFCRASREYYSCISGSGKMLTDSLNSYWVCSLSNMVLKPLKLQNASTETTTVAFIYLGRRKASTSRRVNKPSYTGMIWAPESKYTTFKAFSLCLNRKVDWESVILISFLFGRVYFEL